LKVTNYSHKIKKLELSVINPPSSGSTPLVDFVIIENDANLGKSMVAYLEKDTNVKLYQNPHDFLKDLPSYPKNTRISLDNDFRIPNLDGLKLAQQLHDQGYTNLFMVSGKDCPENEIPAYLIFILKSDPKMMKKLSLIK
jgi:hypothetical protein